jgi:putative OPT family oligopeptide transporter
MEEQLNPKEVAKELATGYRELTFAAVLLGVIQGIVLNLAFVYAALKLGFSIGGSTVAAIMGYTLLTGVMKKGTSVENNINQTIASGINTAGTGIVFTLPALFMLNAKWIADGGAGLEFSVWPLILGGIAGAILGTVLIIPLRKQMIEVERLRFPSGVAVTTIIRSGSSGMDKAKLLGIGFLISAIWKGLMLTGWLEVIGIHDEEFNFGFGIIPDYLSPVLYLSLMNLGAGLLSGRGGLAFFIGGVLSWWVISPVAANSGVFGGSQWVPAAAELEALGMATQEDYIYSVMLRPLGIGTLIGGALMGVVVCFPAIVSAFRSLANSAKTSGSGGSQELPLKVIVIGTIIGITLFFIGSLMTEGVTVWQAVIGSVIGTLWLAVAGLIVAQATGMTDMSPMSGMSLISVTLMMFIFSNNVAAAMVVGVAVCVAIGQGADMMQDLKTGFMLGAKPAKQQIVQFATTWIGALFAIGVIYVLWKSGPGGQGGFGEGTSLPAPQAGALMGIIDAVKSGNVPMDKYAMGGIIGALLGAAPMSGLGVLIGLAMYLPFKITLGYGIGCLSNMALKKMHGVEFIEHKVVPVAAGLIVGEALTGIGHAIYSIVRPFFQG